jgi:hypothetical protein
MAKTCIGEGHVYLLRDLSLVVSGNNRTSFYFHLVSLSGCWQLRANCSRTFTSVKESGSLGSPEMKRVRHLLEYASLNAAMAVSVLLSFDQHRRFFGLFFSGVVAH